MLLRWKRFWNGVRSFFIISQNIVLFPPDSSKKFLFSPVDGIDRGFYHEHRGIKTAAGTIYKQINSFDQK